MAPLWLHLLSLHSSSSLAIFCPAKGQKKKHIYRKESHIRISEGSYSGQSLWKKKACLESLIFSSLLHPLLRTVRNGSHSHLKGRASHTPGRIAEIYFSECFPKRITDQSCFLPGGVFLPAQGWGISLGHTEDIYSHFPSASCSLDLKKNENYLSTVNVTSSSSVKFCQTEMDDE